MLNFNDDFGRLLDGLLDIFVDGLTLCPSRGNAPQRQRTERQRRRVAAGERLAAWRRQFAALEDPGAVLMLRAGLAQLLELFETALDDTLAS